MNVLEILSLAGSLLLSFVIFYVVIVATSIALFKLVFKPIPEDELELIDAKEEALQMKKVKRNQKSFRPTLSLAK